MILDRDKLNAATGGDPALVAEILDMLRDELPRRLAFIRQALEQNRRPDAAHAAHKLQGSAAYTGAVRMGEAAARLETLVAEGGGDPWDALAALERSAEDLLQALESERSG